MGNRVAHPAVLIIIDKWDRLIGWGTNRDKAIPGKLNNRRFISMFNHGDTRYDYGKLA